MSGLIMNKIKQAVTGQSTNHSSSTTQGQNEDYGDKGLDALERKFGHGHSLGRSTNERITDGARTAFQSVTGKNVPGKFSN